MRRLVLQLLQIDASAAGAEHEGSAAAVQLAFQGTAMAFFVGAARSRGGGHRQIGMDTAATGFGINVEHGAARYGHADAAAGSFKTAFPRDFGKARIH